MAPPLHNRNILITRRKEQAGDLQHELERHGATVHFLPTIQIIPPSDWAPVDAALKGLAAFDLIVFASVNAVTLFFHRCVALGISPDLLSSIAVAAVGRKTGAELERLKLRVQLIPDEFSATSLVGHLAKQGVNGKRVLVPEGSLARPEHVQGLREVGAEVHPITVYQTIAADVQDAGPVLQLIQQGKMDVVTFASPSAAQNFARLLPDGSLASVENVTIIAAIGPTTAQAIRELHGTPVIIAAEATAVGLSKSIVAHYRSHA